MNTRQFATVRGFWVLIQYGDQVIIFSLTAAVGGVHIPKSQTDWECDFLTLFSCSILHCLFKCAQALDKRVKYAFTLNTTLALFNVLWLFSADIKSCIATLSTVKA